MLRFKTAFYTVFLIFALFALPAQAAKITIADGAFADQDRGRIVPYRLFAPDPIPKPLPVILYSPGLAANLDSAPYFGEALAAKGYIVIYLEHPGTSEDIWPFNTPFADRKTYVRNAFRKQQNIVDRYLDISMAIDKLTEMSRDPKWSGLFDLDKIGLAGHSYGARDVFIIAGEDDRYYAKNYRDKRVKAGVAISPSLPDSYVDKGDEAARALYNDINIPIMHITGTQDEHPFLENYDPKQRLRPYKYINTTDQYLLVFQGAGQGTFADTPELRTPIIQRPIQDTATKAAIMFFDAYLQGDQFLKQELQFGFKKYIGNNDHFDFKIGNR